MLKQRQVSAKKLEEVKYLTSMLNKYNVVGLAHLNKMPAKSLHNLRSQLRGEVVIHMTKKKIFQRAFIDSKKPNLDELGKMATGITALLFTNMNPFKLAQYLKSKAVKGPAKGGDIAPMDIVVAAGDTKIPPGPIISELNQGLKLPTMIKNGTIHVRTDTVTHKKGEVINDKAAQLLSRLGIEPITIELEFYGAWDAGDVLPDAVLHVDTTKVVEDFKVGAASALNLALSLGIITPETIIPLVIKSQRDAMAVALELPMIIPDLIPNYFQKALAQASVVNASVFGIPETKKAAPDASAKEEKKDSPKKKDETDDEKMGEGIASLFD
jgi:large subunit ribosomal protein L10